MKRTLPEGSEGLGSGAAANEHSASIPGHDHNANQNIVSQAGR